MNFCYYISTGSVGLHHKETMQGYVIDFYTNREGYENVLHTCIYKNDCGKKPILVDLLTVYLNCPGIYVLKTENHPVYLNIKVKRNSDSFTISGGFRSKVHHKKTLSQRFTELEKRRSKLVKRKVLVTDEKLMPAPQKCIVKIEPFLYKNLSRKALAAHQKLDDELELYMSARMNLEFQAQSKLELEKQSPWLKHWGKRFMYEDLDVNELRKHQKLDRELEAYFKGHDRSDE